MAFDGFYIRYINHNFQPIFPIKTSFCTISVEDCWIILANGLAGILAYQCLTIAMRAVMYPSLLLLDTCVYSLLCFGIVLLGEEPNNLVLCGSLIVVLSGIYIILRQNKIKNDKI